MSSEQIAIAEHWAAGRWPSELYQKYLSGTEWLSELSHDDFCTLMCIWVVASGKKA